MIRGNILYNDFCYWRFNLAKAKGPFIWDESGKKLIDFTSGWNVTNLGWNHPELQNAVIDQVKKNTYVPMWTADPIQNKYAQALISSLPKELMVIGRATGGTEANEEAIKTARAYTGRKKIIGFKDTYHGQSYATLALGYSSEYETPKAISPMPEGFLQMDFPKTYGDSRNGVKILADFAEKLEENLAKRDVAAVVTEAGIITGWGSTFVAPKGYLTLVRKLTKKYGTLLILDEVGTGFSRCGRLYGMYLENVIPDIVTFAKGMSNGVAAIGAMVTTKKIAQKTFNKTNLTSTFGWTPIACAVGLKVLEIHQRERIWEKAEKDGCYLISQLKREFKNNRLVENIDGMGMEVGVRFVKSRKEKPIATLIEEKAYEKGLHLISDSETNIQLMPPLTIERRFLNRGIEIFVSLVRTLSSSV